MDRRRHAQPAAHLPRPPDQVRQQPDRRHAQRISLHEAISGPFVLIAFRVAKTSRPKSGFARPPAAHSTNSAWAAAPRPRSPRSRRAFGKSWPFVPLVHAGFSCPLMYCHSMRKIPSPPLSPSPTHTARLAESHFPGERRDSSVRILTQVAILAIDTACHFMHNSATGKPVFSPPKEYADRSPAQEVTP